MRDKEGQVVGLEVDSVQRFQELNRLGGFGQFVGPSVNDGLAIDVFDACHLGPAERRASCRPLDRGSRRVHSHYTRRLSHLPWDGRVASGFRYLGRFRCGNSLALA